MVRIFRTGDFIYRSEFMWRLGGVERAERILRALVEKVIGFLVVSVALE